MKKIRLKLKFNQETKLRNILEYFENVAFFKKDKFWILDIFFFSEIEEIIAKEYLKDKKNLKFLKIEKQNWIQKNIQRDNVRSTKLFSFSQGLKKNIKKKKKSSLFSSFRGFWNGIAYINTSSYPKY